MITLGKGSNGKHSHASSAKSANSKGIIVTDSEEEDSKYVIDGPKSATLFSRNDKKGSQTRAAAPADYKLSYVH